MSVANQMKKQKLSWILAFLSWYIHAIDDNHYWLPAPTLTEPRLLHPSLTTIDLSLGGCATSCAYNKHGVQVPLGGRLLGKCFKDCGGKFDLFQAQFDVYQNFPKGFYLHLNLPLRSVSFFVEKQSSYKELHLGGAGDLSMLLGWTMSNEDLCTLDFAECSVEMGILFPTGKTTHAPQIPFSLGNFHHWGFNAAWTGALGLYEWLTLGTHIDGLFLFKTKGHCHEGLCNAYNIDVYTAADHVVIGLSARLGYRFSHRENDYTRHLLQFYASYDFSKPTRASSIRCGILLAHTFAGKNCLANSFKGATLGVDCSWEF